MEILFTPPTPVPHLTFAADDFRVINCRALMKIFERYDTILFDCDGVLWTGMDPVPGAADALNKLRDLGKKIIFVTNNSTKNEALLLSAFDERLGIADIEGSHVYSSGMSAASYLKKRLKAGEKVYLIGSPGFKSIMEENGIDFIGYGPLENRQVPEWASWEPDPAVKYVAGGMDLHFTHTKMTEAYLYIKEFGATYVASNVDMTYPMTNRTLPGTGAILSGLTASLGIKPIVTGKPSKTMYDIISEDHDLGDPERVLMVGDRLDTDIQFGINAGVDTVMVCTGVSAVEEITEECRPKYVLDSVVDLFTTDAI